MNKKVLIMCTGNSCRSIIGEALVNSSLDGVEAYSCGIVPSGRVHPHAKAVLEEHNMWKSTYHSKHLDELSCMNFDLVVTVCSHANETCPVFPHVTKTLHVGFEDPDGKEYEAFVATYKEIQEVLLPAVKKAFA
ncbi:arsenate reductase ArsC [Sulfurimonas sp. SAG-AH-194-I05]|nr:arsenate reductase ArsC [Sulfurimonas sp. SAG-AH-194-I05]MDF1874904.1 arsenate reductase ArsC [Sulfurimonas sp. SAG-AH-194-I05]